jgi:hypothetical protein
MKKLNFRNAAIVPEDIGRASVGAETLCPLFYLPHPVGKIFKYSRVFLLVYIERRTSYCHPILKIKDPVAKEICDFAKFYD